MKKWSSQPPNHGKNLWKGGAELGAGSFGAAWAFYCENEEGLVTDRIAVKDTVLRRDHFVSRERVLQLVNVAILTFVQNDWARWWGFPWDAKNREHMEIKVMQDIVDDAKASRCVVIRGSKHSPELYSMCSHPSCFHLTCTANHDQLTELS